MKITTITIFHGIMSSTTTTTTTDTAAAAGETTETLSSCCADSTSSTVDTTACDYDYDEEDDHGDVDDDSKQQQQHQQQQQQQDDDDYYSTQSPSVCFNLARNQYHEPHITRLTEDDYHYGWYSKQDIQRFRRGCSIHADLNGAPMSIHLDTLFKACDQAQEETEEFLIDDPRCLQACLELSRSPCRSFFFRFHGEMNRRRRVIRETILDMNLFSSNHEDAAFASKKLSLPSRMLALLMAQADAQLAEAEDSFDNSQEVKDTAATDSLSLQERLLLMIQPAEKQLSLDAVPLKRPGYDGDDDPSKPLQPRR